MKKPKTPLKHDAVLSPPARLSHVRQACPGSRLAWLAIWLTSLLTIAPHAAWAQIRNWTNPVGGVFGVAENWLNNLSPGPGEAAYFQLPNTYTVDFNSNVSNGSLNVQNGEVTLNLNGHGYQLTGPFSLSVSGLDDDAPSLFLTGGTLGSVAAGIGPSPASRGSMVVRGNDTLWNNNSGLHVGMFGTGKLIIDEGANVASTYGSIATAPDSKGAVAVRGTNSTWSTSGALYVGWGGNGKLTIDDGAGVFSQFAEIAYDPGSEGEAIVRGPNSAWTINSSLFIGGSGTGNLMIENGASVTNTIGHIGAWFASQGEVTVRGADSIWTNSSALTIGMRGTGTLTIEDGAQVTSRFTSSLGSGIDSLGEVTVRGANSSWDNDGILRVGIEGTGKLTIEDGASVSNTSASIGRPFLGSKGEVAVRGAGSTWTNHGDVTVGSVFSIGQLTVEDGGMVVVNNGTGSLSLLATGTLTGGGGTVLGNVRNGGIVAPGNSAGTLLIDGDFTQFVNGRVQIELGGTVAGSQYDQLVVTGNAALNGSLELVFINDFELRPRQWFDVLPVAGLLTGTFAGLDEGDVVGTFGGVDLFITYAGGGVALYTIPEPSTWLLLATSGFALLWQAAKKRRRMQSIRQERRSH